ncbi:MAG: 4Fe-4S dicluster domain-containing protein, partial [Planctomycetota bacterium]
AVSHSFDLALTEHGGGAEPTRFACEVGSARGAEILAAALAEPIDEPGDRGKSRRVGSEAATRSRGFHRPPAAGGGTGSDACTPAEVARARQVPQDLAARMHAREAEPGRPRPRSLDTEGIRDLLFGNLEHPRWEEVASRCLSCTNCTLVCPTCFCASVTEVADLSGDQADRERHWASCFTLDHAKIHGHSVRTSTASRYRQWLTHKLAGWIDQFGTSGCTGCGRCITWCPVGIDITEEVAAIRETSGATKPAGGAA